VRSERGRGKKGKEGIGRIREGKGNEKRVVEKNRRKEREGGMERGDGMYRLHRLLSTDDRSKWKSCHQMCSQSMWND